MIGSSAALGRRLAGAAMVERRWPPTPAAAADLALKRVVLSSGGVGYFEYEAPVEGDATVTLDVPLDQVDDVLKSLVVYDCGGTRRRGHAARAGAAGAELCRPAVRSAPR